MSFEFTHRLEVASVCLNEVDTLFPYSLMVILRVIKLITK